MTLKLSRQERKQAFAGTLNVLRRPSKPDIEAGEAIVLSYTRGGKQVVERDERKRQQLLDERKPITVDVPKQPNLWIVIKGWHLKQGSTIWETAVTIHDRREPIRILSGGSPGTPSEPALKTRWGRTVEKDGIAHKKRVPKKGEQVESLTSETERGYGGGGRSAVDDRPAKGDPVSGESVDDAVLEHFACEVQDENALRRRGDHGLAEKKRGDRLSPPRVRGPKRGRGVRRRGARHRVAV